MSNFSTFHIVWPPLFLFGGGEGWDFLVKIEGSLCRERLYREGGQALLFINKVWIL